MFYFVGADIILEVDLGIIVVYFVVFVYFVLFAFRLTILWPNISNCLFYFVGI